MEVKAFRAASSSARLTDENKEEEEDCVIMAHIYLKTSAIAAK